MNQQLPTNIGFCRRCVQQRETLVIPDTLADEEYATDAVVTSEPYARFYAGVPLIVPGGEAIGTISIVDRIPRHITPKQLEALQAISRLIVTQLEVRRNSIEDKTAGKRSDVQICEPTALLDIATDAIIMRDLSHNILVWNKSAERIGTLASGIAHDLNNVLSPILMSIYLLTRKCGDRQTQQILSIIENNTKHSYRYH